MQGRFARRIDGGTDEQGASCGLERHEDRILMRTGRTILIVLSSLSALGAWADDARVRPKVVVLLADSVALMDLGAYGGEARTPNIDGLARRGALFEQLRSSPQCALRGSTTSADRTVRPTIPGAGPSEAIRPSSGTSRTHTREASTDRTSCTARRASPKSSRKRSGASS